MKVSELVGHAKGMDGKTSDEIKASLDAQMPLAKMMRQGDDLRALQDMIQKDFKGDARAAVDFVKQHGNDPAIANQQVAPFVNSGAASQYVQQKLGQQPAMAANAPATAPQAPKPTPVGTPPQAQNLSQINPNAAMPNLGSMASNLASWAGAGTQSPTAQSKGLTGGLLGAVTEMVTQGAMYAISNKVAAEGASLGTQALGMQGTESIVRGVTQGTTNTLASILSPPKPPMA